MWHQGSAVHFRRIGMGKTSGCRDGRLIFFGINPRIFPRIAKLLEIKRSVVCFAAACTGLLAVVACGGKGGVSKAAGLPEVEVTKPIEREVYEYEILPGRVQAVDDVEIKARVTGSLDEMKFVEGSEAKSQLVERGGPVA